LKYWQTMNRVLGTLVLFLSVIVQAPAASADTLTTIAYEGFDYPAGSLDGANGGSGWSGAWAFSQAGDSPLAVTATGLTYPDLTVQGGATVYGGNRAINGSGRELSRLDSGIIYVRFLVKLSGGFSNGAPTLRLYDSTLANNTLLVGSNNTGPNASIITTEGTPRVANSGVLINDNQTHLLLVRIDYSSSTVDLWVDPNLATFNYGSPPTANATLTSYAPTFNRVDIFNRVSGSYDEITVMRFTSGGASSGSSSASVEATRTLQLSDVDGKCQGVTSIRGSNSSWVQLPSADQCADPGRVLLGWSTSAQFPSSVAQAQIDKGWGAIDGEIDGTQMIFIPAGGFAFLTGDNTLYPVWSA
jgi:hypothetical protein